MPIVKSRNIPHIPPYRGSDRNVSVVFDKIREAFQKMFDSDLITEKDIYCKELIISEDSIYIGAKDNRHKLKLIDDEGDNWLEFNDQTLAKESTLSGYALVTHNHDSDYAALSHDHDGEHLGNVTFGDHSGGDYAEFEADGTLEFNGAATVWDDQQINISSVRLPASNMPTWTAYKGSQVLAFSPGEIIYFTAQLSHKYMEGSDIEFHIHTVLPVAGSGAGAENVKWNFTYSWASIDDSFPAETTVSEEFDVQSRSADVHTLDQIAATIDGTDQGISGVLLCSLERDNAMADEYGDDVYLVAADFHIEMNTLGSRGEDTK